MKSPRSRIKGQAAAERCVLNHRSVTARKAFGLLLFTAVATGPITYSSLAQSPKSPVKADWSDYLGGPSGSHYSPLREINRSNVSQLQTAWQFSTGDDTAYTFSPLVVDNVAYVAAEHGSLVALDATTGKEIWVHRFASAGGANPFLGAGIAGIRGTNYWQSKDGSDRRILVEAGGFLNAINAKTGELVDAFGDHGRVDLKTGIEGATAPVSARSPGRVFENLLILGSSTGEGYLPPPGDIRAFDVVTGKLIWVFHTIPHPGEIGYESWEKDAWKYMGGVDVWGEITVDNKTGTAFFPVASAKYELWGGDRPGSNLFADCVLALDARTGKYKWSFQTIHHDIWDYDLVSAPQLATITHNGKKVDIVAQATKQGFLYVLDRTTGKPIWPVEERPVPQSTVPGEKSWPTEPYPTLPPPFAKQTFTADDLNPAYLPGDQLQIWKDKVNKAVNQGLYTPPGLTETVQMPGNNGGASFFDTAAIADKGLVFVLSHDLPALFLKLVPEPKDPGYPGNSIPTRLPSATAAGGRPRTVQSPEQVGRAIYNQNCQMCHGPDLKGDRGPQIDNVISRLGPDQTAEVIRHGRNGAMPAFNIPAGAMESLLAFLKAPSLAPSTSGDAAAGVSFGRMVDSKPYPPGVEAPAVRYKTGYALESLAIKPPYSYITAFDLNTGKIKWQSPFGDFPQEGPATGKLRGNPDPKSGFVITAGGLVIYADASAKLYAEDIDTGKVLATVDLPTGSKGLPAVYSANGKEYILVDVSGSNSQNLPLAPGGTNSPKQGHFYMAFALPSK